FYFKDGNLIWFRKFKKEISSAFLVQYFKSYIGQHSLESTMIGSAQKALTIVGLKGITVKFPPLPEQTAIASILSSLDDKIDLLHRQNKTLEQLAETLFRQWFVEEADESWEVGKLDDIVSVKGGTTPDTTISRYWNGNIFWTTPRDLSNHDSVFLFDTERKITEAGLARIGSGLLPIGTVLLSSRAPIGYLAITEISVAINQGYIAIICNKKVSNYFIYLWCKANLEEIKNAGNGSVFQEISKTTFKDLDILIPPLSKLDKFDKLIEPPFQKIKTNQIQIQTLTKLRDTLLPKLMSGEVRVKV
ncbi:MAG: restriction endonuclease subunit S, partial [Sphingobacteriaceae bacterium]